MPDPAPNLRRALALAETLTDVLRASNADHAEQCAALAIVQTLVELSEGQLAMHPLLTAPRTDDIAEIGEDFHDLRALIASLLKALTADVDGVQRMKRKIAACLTVMTAA